MPVWALEDGARHDYCLYCHGESVEWRTDGNRRWCFCRSCGRDADRSITIDPGISWWLTPDGEYWHETAGIVVQDSRRRVLFFERTAFPFGLTVPAGHVERAEPVKEAALRELAEETGIVDRDLRFLGRSPVAGDKCRRGADTHLWHLFQVIVPESTTVVLNEEGKSPVWLPLSDAWSHDLTPAVAYLLDLHADTLERM